VNGNVASIFLEEYADQGGVRDVITLARLVGLWKIAEAITGRDLNATVEVGVPEPAYYARLAHMLPPVTFGHCATRALMSTEVLDYPLVTANPVALRLAAEQCARELASLSSGGRLIRAVRGLVGEREGRARPASEVARAMHMSPRSLRRKLQAQGISLFTLLDQERRDRALVLMQSPELSLAEIAERVGYQNTRNFERAFRRWTGRSPAAYRRS
jgi:AraC-like DNA-binding protein